MERLNEIYNNCHNDDNTVLIRSLNTFLENGINDPSIICENVLYFVRLFEILLKTNNRPSIKFVVDAIQSVEMTQSFSNFIQLLEQVHEQDMRDYKYLFLMCYCRSKFESHFTDKIKYTNPKYAVMEAMGQHNRWAVLFVEAYKQNEFIYI